MIRYITGLRPATQGVKLSDDEWNAAVALALECKGKAEAGKITDLEQS
ncbi:hypothetical protein L9W92_16130 [Pelotomaculum terephthalicicum JT]|nr:MULTISPECIES: hypothetical protein [Pelotomaculum]MCG9969532.1 hypothetical protein [Pelotomaculum terephthalicicum JT]